ncbi:hypothetical protein [Amycolatopsis echigonensis]|jgi:NADH:ubiquinone oxidoreductase subunit 6 (subunit J)|uniref:Uncharacterized protein n=1 Tax=Amycolatopsis echigonensis TaxID=2576905 RepID=A0A2N3WG14_9PSEU|nr:MULTISPECIES: hypothetical protein [Amycolatopsis]MBB2497896.1 hypothetical protein [Amycolatopsis echigonensis]PKV92814.1 hypothetical protein ATK30_3643 [Amycolatopsis niigatensis]
MFSIVLTWVGAVLGLTLLVAMAVGAFVVDFDEALRERRVKARGTAEPTS